MALLDQQPDQIAFFIFSFAAFSGFASGGSFGDNAVLGSSALFLTIPRMLVDVVFQNFPMLAPLAVLAFFYYFVLVKRHVGDALTAAMALGAIAVMSGF